MRFPGEVSKTWPGFAGYTFVRICGGFSEGVCSIRLRGLLGGVSVYGCLYYNDFTSCYPVLVKKLPHNGIVKGCSGTEICTAIRFYVQVFTSNRKFSQQGSLNSHEGVFLFRLTKNVSKNSANKISVDKIISLTFGNW